MQQKFFLSACNAFYQLNHESFASKGLQQKRPLTFRRFRNACKIEQFLLDTFFCKVTYILLLTLLFFLMISTFFGRSY